MLSKIKALIRLARTTSVANDSKQFPIQQVKGHTRQDVMVMFPYGIHASMSVDALVALLSVNGDESNSIAIGGWTEKRPKMEEGENCIFHPPTGTKIHFKADGTIEINTKGKDTTVNLKGNLNVSGEIKAVGEITSGSVTLTGHTHPAVGTIVTTATVGASSSPGTISGSTDKGVG